MTALNHTTVNGIKLEVRMLMLDTPDDFLLRKSADIVLAPHNYTGHKGQVCALESTLAHVQLDSRDLEAE